MYFTAGSLIMVLVIIFIVLPIIIFCQTKDVRKQQLALAGLEDPEANRNTELQPSAANSLRNSVNVNNAAATDSNTSAENDSSEEDREEEQSES